MKDLRLIDSDDDGVIRLTADKINEPFDDELQWAIQRALIALVTTPGTVLDAAAYGGGAHALMLRMRTSNDSIRNAINAAVTQAEQSLLPTEPTNTAYRIVRMELTRVDLENTGFVMHVSLSFAGGTQETFSAYGVIDESG